VKPVLITGSSGLIGTTLREALRLAGFETRGFDLRGPPTEWGDVTDLQAVQDAVDSSCGVVHLAAMSRVARCEHAPVECMRTNVGGTQNVVYAVLRSEARPWVVFASSREVYGHLRGRIARETDPHEPVNVYGHSKVVGENLVNLLRSQRIPTAVARLSNVYGAVNDHADRVIPAFVRAALRGSALRVEGEGCSFDFTHVTDVADGLLKICQHLDNNRTSLPPIQFVSGISTTLGSLASTIVRESRSSSAVEVGLPREFDVSSFSGSPLRAKELLEWSPSVDLLTGLRRLVHDFSFCE
jgi:UDP-glucose 4-epimerase